MGIIDAWKDYRDSKRTAEYGGEGYTLLSQQDTQAAVKAAAVSMEFQRGPIGWDTFGGWWQSSGVNAVYNRNDVKISNELGDVRLLSLVIAAVRWAARNYTDARFKVVTLDNDRKESEIIDHELTQVFKRPNPFYSGLTFWCGMMLSNICRGEMHALKRRSGVGRMVELWYEPYWTIRPRWDTNGKDFISYYEIYRNGQWRKWGKDADDVFVVYDIGLDPETRRGMLNATASLVQEFFTDKQMSRFLGALFQKGLVPPVVFSVGDKETPAPTGSAWTALVADIERRFGTGEAMGKPFVSNGPIKSDVLGYDYSSMGLDSVREGIEARFASAMGISVISLMLSAGLKHSAYNNVKEYHIHDYRSYIVPLHKQVCAEIDHQLLPEYGETTGKESRWDYSEVAVMQRDRLEVARETDLLVRNRTIDQAEARERHNYKSDESHKDVYFPVQATTLTISPIEPQSEPEIDPMLDDSVVKPNGAARVS